MRIDCVTLFKIIIKSTQYLSRTFLLKITKEATNILKNIRRRRNYDPIVNDSTLKFLNYITLKQKYGNWN